MTVVLLDVNETLSDMAPLADRFADVGVAPLVWSTWFAATLRDGSALTLAGTPRPFAEVARGVLARLWDEHGVTDAATATAHVLDALTSLDVHPDVAPGITALAEAGHRVVTLSNGAASVAEALLARAGVAEHVEAMLSVDDAGAWKPDPRAYHFAAEVCGVEPHEMVLVAVHPWDLHGAAAAGVRGAYVERRPTPWPDVFDRPDLTVHGLDELPGRLQPVEQPAE